MVWNLWKTHAMHLRFLRTMAQQQQSKGYCYCQLSPGRRQRQSPDKCNEEQTCSKESFWHLAEVSSFNVGLAVITDQSVRIECNLSQHTWEIIANKIAWDHCPKESMGGGGVTCQCRWWHLWLSRGNWLKLVLRLNPGLLQTLTPFLHRQRMNEPFLLHKKLKRYTFINNHYWTQEFNMTRQLLVRTATKKVIKDWRLLFSPDGTELRKCFSTSPPRTTKLAGWLAPDIGWRFRPTSQTKSHSWGPTFPGGNTSSDWEGVTGQRTHWATGSSNTALCLFQRLPSEHIFLGTTSFMTARNKQLGVVAVCLMHIGSMERVLCHGTGAHNLYTKQMTAHWKYHWWFRSKFRQILSNSTNIIAFASPAALIMSSSSGIVESQYLLMVRISRWCQALNNNNWTAHCNRTLCHWVHDPSPQWEDRTMR